LPEVDSLAAARTRGASPVYFDGFVEKDCIAFYLPVSRESYADGILSILPARNLLDMSSVRAEDVSAVALVTSDGKVLGAAYDEGFGDAFGIQMDTFLSFFTGDVSAEKTVFDSLSSGERTSVAVEKLWEAILSTSRVVEGQDSVKAWQEHNADLKARCDYLNSLGIEKLHYTADNGTELTVGMIGEAIFCGGAELSKQNIVFNPNIPTEECFISPKKGEAEGIVYATKPLSYQGQLIENFWMRFEGGKAVEVGAEKGQELLQQMVNMDEGAGYLGECALVPQTSPINVTDLLFYNTLFDENAVCHLAVGRGFNDTIRGYHEKTNEECKALGINESMIHVDFMIGCDSMNIDATCADGKVVPIFRNGNWAF
jgi:aminopeptidase